MVENLVKSLLAEPDMQHLNRVLLPDREIIIDCVKRLRQIIFPGYFGKPGLTRDNISDRIGELVREVTEMLYQQVRCCLRYREPVVRGAETRRRCVPPKCDHAARHKSSRRFLDRNAQRFAK